MPRKKPLAPLPPHYAAILAAAEGKGLPLHFRNDLVEHDRGALLARNVRLPFIWGVSEHGTHLIFPEARPRGDGRIQSTAAPLVRWIDEAQGPGFVHWHVWTGSELRAVPSADAQAFLEENANLKPWIVQACVDGEWVTEWRGDGNATREEAERIAHHLGLQAGDLDRVRAVES